MLIGKPMLIGYARTSTLDQIAGLEAQIRDLTAAGCERIFQEQVSSVDQENRLELAQALSYAREGDTLVITKLDRLARSSRHLGELLETLKARGVALRILDLGVDTGSPVGALILTIMGGFAQFERDIMLERQREGIAKAKAEGRFRGRKPSFDAEKLAQVRTMLAEGAGVSTVAKATGLSRQAVYRVRDGGVDGDLAVARWEP